jgi:hypothetical protein
MKNTPPPNGFQDRSSWAAGTPVEMPTVRARKARTFIPALPRHLFCRLAKLPGKCLAVYLVLALRWRLERRPRAVNITTRWLASFGLTKNDKHRALRSLERAGLVTVTRLNGKNPVITLVPVPQESEGDDVSDRGEFRNP